MADFLDDGEFWLLSRFLTEDDPFIDSRSFYPKVTADLFSVYGSDLGSPVESLFGSTENESDEEDMLVDLSRNMARSTLDDGFKNPGAGSRRSSSPATRIENGGPVGASRQGLTRSPSMRRTNSHE